MVETPLSLVFIAVLLLVVSTPVTSFAFGATRPLAVVTGANRGLGLAISEVLAEEGYHVLMTSRNIAEGEMAAARLRDQGLVVEHTHLDVTNPNHVKSIQDRLHQTKANVDLLVNNAGVCIRGGLNERVLSESMEVNAWGPLRLAQALAPFMSPREIAATTSSGSRVINVSSGDGELVYLNQEVAQAVRDATSLEELEDYISDLSRSLCMVIGDKAGPVSSGGSKEVAHLPWPAYCLSKATLNAITRILATIDERHVTAVCPGDVATAMCDIDPTSALSPREAAQDVVWVAQNPHLCPPGHFYRHRKVIPF